MATVPAIAQECDPDLDPFCEVNPDDPEVPLDGGVMFMVAGAMAYGFKKFRDRNEGDNQVAP